jgi:DNA polymerase III subunit epsilon
MGGRASAVGMFIYETDERRLLRGPLPYVVVDLETTGLNGADDRIAEVALVRIEDRRGRRCIEGARA